MMNIFKKIIKRLTCKHKYEIKKQIAFDGGVAIAERCTLCDKAKVLLNYNV